MKPWVNEPACGRIDRDCAACNDSPRQAARDGMEPALEVLAAAVVASGNAEKVRLKLLFDKGGVLPMEMPAAAGKALKKGLVEAAGEA